MANQPTDKDKPGAIHKGLADEIVFEGHPGTKSKHEPKLAGAFKQGIGAALARLMADPEQRLNRFCRRGVNMHFKVNSPKISRHRQVIARRAHFLPFR